MNSRPRSSHSRPIHSTERTLRQRAKPLQFAGNQHRTAQAGRYARVPRLAYQNKRPAHLRRARADRWPDRGRDSRPELSRDRSWRSGESQDQGASVVVAGTVSGEITATERIEIRPSARISGNLAAPRMAMHEGAIFEGRCAMKPEEGRKERKPTVVGSEEQMESRPAVQKSA
jgi:hypothetical protein